MTTRPRALLPTLCVVAVGAVALLWHARLYASYFVDDSFISLRYADRLLHGHGLTWDDSERVEGYSNLLWTVACAALGLVHTDLVADARLLGALSSMASLGAIVWACRPRQGSARELWPSVFGAALFAASGTVAAWTLAGLEAPLVAALLAWASVGFGDGEIDAPRSKRVGLALGLMALCRPDAALLGVTLSVGFAVLCVWRRRARPDGASRAVRQTLVHYARIGLIVGLFLAGQLVFRRVYYHAWLPNTARVKLAFNGARVAAGLIYLKPALRSGWPLLVTVAAVTGAALRADAKAAFRLAPPLFAAAVWLVYVALIGGDIFLAYRHVFPVVTLLALVAAEAMAIFIRARPRSAATAAAFGLIGLVMFARLQQRDRFVTTAKTVVWQWDGQAVGDSLGAAFGARAPRVAVDAAGAVPYFSRLPALDMLGLNDTYIATHLPTNFGRGQLGHEVGDGAYVLSRAPDIVIFGLPAGGPYPTFIGGQQMFADPRFGVDYALVHWRARGPKGEVISQMYLRRESARLGVVREDGTLELPGFFFALVPCAVAELAESSRPVATFAPNCDVTTPVRLTRGSWAVRVEGEGDVRATAGGETHSDAPGLTLRVAESGGVDVRIASGRGGRLRAVRFTRLP